MKVVIAGGGIGGLSAAIALCKVGFEVEVVERASALQEVGAGLQLSPNATKGLASLGVLEAVAAISSIPETLEMRIGRTGQKVFSIPIAREARNRYGAPYLHAHRADLIDILSRAAVQAGAQIRLGARVSAYVRDDAGLRVGLDTGAILPCDLLVGADGVRSTVRRQMLGEEAPRFTGAVAWRMTAPADVAPDLPQSAIVWAGPGKHAVTYRIRRGTLINFVGVTEQKEWTSESWDQLGDPVELAHGLALQSAVQQHVKSRARNREDRDARERYAQLSEREREVLGLIVAGLTNKEIGRALDVSPRTIETHRANLFAKLEADSLAQLIRHYASLVDADS